MILSSFIKWDNFTDHEVLFWWFQHLFFILLLAYVSINASYLIWSRLSDTNFPKAFEASLRYLLGLALISFSIAFLGLIGFFNLHGLLISILILTIFAFVKDRYSGSATLSLIRSFLKLNYPLLIFGILISINSLLLPFKNDEVTYHLAFPEYWYSVNKIELLSTMRYPTYTFNYHMWALFGNVFGSPTFSHFINWSVGISLAFSLYGSVIYLKLKKVFAYLAFFAFLLTPIIQQYLNTFYIDIAYQAYLFMSIFLIGVLFKDPQKRKDLFLPFVLIASFFMGIKITGIGYLPFFGLILFYLTRRQLNQGVWLLLTLGILSSIWYVRSFYLTGDPLWPALNLSIRGTDAFWNVEDLRLNSALIKSHQARWGWKIFYELPIFMLSSKNGAWPLLAYTLAAPFLIFLYLKRFLKDQFLIMLVMFYAITLLIWILTSVQLRYAYFVPMSILICTLGLHWMYIKSKGLFLKSIVILLSFFIMLGPSTHAYSFTKNFFAKRIHTERNEQLTQAAYGKNCIREIYQLRSDSIIEKSAKVYTLGFLNYRYYFYKNDILVYGDDFGNYRKRDYLKLYNENRIFERLRRDSIPYLLVDKKYWPPAHALDESVIKLYDGECFILLNSK